MTFSMNGRSLVQVFGCVTHERGGWHKGRVIDTHLILYITAGTVPMQIGDKVYDAKVGDILFIPKGIHYRPLASHGCTYYFFHFDMEEADEDVIPAPAVSALNTSATGFAYSFGMQTDCPLYLDTHFTPIDQSGIQKVLQRASSLDLLHDGRQRARLVVYFQDFLVRLQKGHWANTQPDSTVERIIHYIHDHITSPISLSHIAEAMYLSESYIARLFQREVKESVGAYILKLKMSMACTLLMDTDMQVSEIASHIGYANPYYFSNVFSKYMGISPMAYRKQF